MSFKPSSKFACRSIRLPDGSCYSTTKRIKSHCPNSCIHLAKELGFPNDWQFFYITKIHNEFCLLPSCVPRSVDQFRDKISRLYFLFFLCDMCSIKRIRPRQSLDSSDVDLLNDIIVTNRNGLKTSSADRLASQAILDADEVVNRLLSTLLSIPSLIRETFSIKDHNGTAYDLGVSCDCIDLKPKFNANHSDRISWNLLGDARSLKSSVRIPYCGNVNPASSLVSFVKRSRPKRSLSCHRSSHQLRAAYGVEQRTDSLSDPESDNTYINFVCTDAILAERLAYRLRATRACVLQLNVGPIPGGGGDSADDTDPSELQIQRSATFSNLNRQLKHTFRRISLPFVKKWKPNGGPHESVHSPLDGTEDTSSVVAVPVASSTRPQSTLMNIGADKGFPSDSVNSCPLGCMAQTLHTCSTTPLEATVTQSAAGEAEADVCLDPLLRPVLNASSLSPTSDEDRLSSFVTTTAPEPTFSTGVKVVGMPPFPSLSTRLTGPVDKASIFPPPIAPSNSSTLSVKLHAKEAPTFHHSPSGISTGLDGTQPCVPQVNSDRRLKSTIHAQSQEQTSVGKVREKFSDTKPLAVASERAQLELSHDQPVSSSSVTITSTVPQTGSIENTLESYRPTISTSGSSPTPQQTLSFISQYEPKSAKPIEKSFTMNTPPEATAVSSTEFVHKGVHTPNCALDARNYQGAPATGPSIDPHVITQNREMLSGAVPGVSVTAESPQKCSSGSRIKPPSLQPHLPSNKNDVLAHTPEFPAPYISTHQQNPSVSDLSGLPAPKVLYETRNEQSVSDLTVIATHASSSIKPTTGVLPTGLGSCTSPTPARSDSAVTSVLPTHSENALHPVSGAPIGSRIRPPIIDPGLHFRTVVTSSDPKETTFAGVCPNNVFLPHSIPLPTRHSSFERNTSIPISLGSQLRHPLSTLSSGIRPPSLRLPAPGMPSQPSGNLPPASSHAAIAQGATNGGVHTSSHFPPTSVRTGIRPPRVLQSP